MDILYYSNYCKHSQSIVGYITKSALIEKLNCICIDRRSRDPVTNQLMIQLENGKKVIMPPNVHSVPALLIVNQKYTAIFGDEIIKYFEPNVQTKTVEATQSVGGEPMGFHLGQSANIVSEQFTYYNMSPEELSAKGRGAKRQMYNYVSAGHDIITIQTPPDNYEPDKVEEGVSIDTLIQKRNKEITPSIPMNPLGI